MSQLETNTASLQAILDTVNALPEAGSGGDSGQQVAPKAVNFYDFDGTCVYAYTAAEAQNLAELPAGPEHEGLVFQGWSWPLEKVNGVTVAADICATYTTADGATYVHVSLAEGRTSPMLGCGVNGTVTVDWGDGSDPDALEGTSVSTTVWTDNHDYAEPGNYTIRLTIEGEMAFTGDSTTGGSNILRSVPESEGANYAYILAVKSIAIGNNVTSVGSYAFYNSLNLETIIIPNGVTSIGEYAFNGARSLRTLTIPEGVTSIASWTFSNSCDLLAFTIPEGVTSIENYTMSYAYALRTLTIPDGVTSIGSSAFANCRRLTTVTVPGSVTSIGTYAFSNCGSVACYDFSKHTTVPTLAATNAFQNMAGDCKIRVPSALLSTWQAATNWATYASHIVAV